MTDLHRSTRGYPVDAAPVSAPARDGAARATGPRPRRIRVTRRGLQVALGLLWLLDGALQFQPFMLSTGFAHDIIGPAGDGQPTFVATGVHWAARMIAAHPVAWDVPFAAIQLLIGLGLLYPRTVKLALAASLPWALGVWYFGEGLGGLASGGTSLLTGAPGAVLLYAVLALAAWPRRGRPDVPSSRSLVLAWVSLWAGGAILQALPGNNSGAAVASIIESSSTAAPHWLATLDSSVAAWFSHHDAAVYGLIAVEALVGLAALAPKSARPGFAVGLLLAVAIWLVPQNFGQISSGQATDPNTAPLIALMGVALLAGRGRSIRWPLRPGIPGDHRAGHKEPGAELNP